MAESSSQNNPDFQQPNSPPISEAERTGIPLTQLEPGKKAKVVAIQGGWGVKRRLNHMGIHPGDLVMVSRQGSPGGAHRHRSPRVPGSLGEGSGLSEFRGIHP